MSKKFFNPYPKYLQVRQILLRLIQTELAVGDQIPTEEALCAQFGVSRETVRAALTTLEQEGLIHRQRGRGTFVSERVKPMPEKRLTGVSEDFYALKLNTGVVAIESGPAEAPHGVVLEDNETNNHIVYRFARLTLYDDIPLAFHEVYMPIRLGMRLEKMDLSRTSLRFEIENTLKIPLYDDVHKVDALIADPRMAELLNVEIGVPVLQLTRICVTTAGKNLVLFRSTYRSDRYYYTVKLGQSMGTKRSGRASAATSQT